MERPSIWRPGKAVPMAKLLVLASSTLPQWLGAHAAPMRRAVEWTGVSISGHKTAPPGSEEFWTKLAFSGVLVALGGVFAGLTLGLMGLDLVNLQVMSTSGEDKEREDSAKVIKLLDKGRHWVLVCLLLSNTVVNESLPIFLDSVLGGGVFAVILSTALIVVFGEIIPQSVCARFGLRIGAACSPFVLALMYLTFPLSWPIARLLDYVLGESHGTLYKKAELKTFVALHRQIGEETLNEDEVTIISSVLELSDKPVSLIMTNIGDTYTLSADRRLDETLVDEILGLGHSRIPIHQSGNNKNFIGMLIVKKLISYDPSQALTIDSFPLSILPETSPESTCLDALNYGRSHILLVSETPGTAGGAIGVVTLEDVIEEMIGEEIVDETDLYVDLNNKIKVVRGAQKRVATGKALAPLIQGVIERRRTAYRQNSLNFSPEYGSTMNDSGPPTSSPAPVVLNPAAKAFQKIKVKGGGVPELRSQLLARTDSNSLLRVIRQPNDSTSNLSLNNSPYSSTPSVRQNEEEEREQEQQEQVEREEEEEERKVRKTSQANDASKGNGVDGERKPLLGSKK